MGCLFLILVIAGVVLYGIALLTAFGVFLAAISFLVAVALGCFALYCIGVGIYLIYCHFKGKGITFSEVNSRIKSNTDLKELLKWILIIGLVILFSYLMFSFTKFM